MHDDDDDDDEDDVLFVIRHRPAFTGNMFTNFSQR